VDTFTLGGEELANHLCFIQIDISSEKILNPELLKIVQKGITELKT
jgi:hypothetical protein